MKEKVCAWAPATIANLNVGFDALGCALLEPGERIWATRNPNHRTVRIVEVKGAANLSMQIEENVAGKAAHSLHKALDPGVGIDLVIEKQIAPGSGIGSSAASAAAAVVAVSGLLDAELRKDELLPFALDGEELASGARHADNVAPALMGGLVLCPPEGKPRSIPLPAEWTLVVVHPQVEIRTADSRGVLPSHVPLVDAVNQARWLGTFVSACHDGDGANALFALADLLVGPQRKRLIPAFDIIEELAFAHGARAGGISGSGPSTFWAGESDWRPEAFVKSVRQCLLSNDTQVQIHTTRISKAGAHLIS